MPPGCHLLVGNARLENCVREGRTWPIRRELPEHRRPPHTFPSRLPTPNGWPPVIVPSFALQRPVMVDVADAGANGRQPQHLCSPQLGKGFVDLFICKGDLRVLPGHQRQGAAKVMGFWSPAGATMPASCRGGAREERGRSARRGRPCGGAGACRGGWRPRASGTCRGPDRLRCRQTERPAVQAARPDESHRPVVSVTGLSPPDVPPPAEESLQTAECGAEVPHGQPMASFIGLRQGSSSFIRKNPQNRYNRIASARLLLQIAKSEQTEEKLAVQSGPPYGRPQATSR